ncbi:MAG: DUF4129 domain-containing protein [Bacteroidetes bacterium]|nr:MAG: DUF4129 domain-containing protein [Bacteroidota bacterium]
MRKLLLFILSILSFPLFANNTWTRDTAIYRIRDFEESQLQELRKDDRYHYEEAELERDAPSMWQLLNDWIKDLLKKYNLNHEPETVEMWTNILIWSLVGIALLLVIWFLARNSNFAQLFKRGDQDLKEAIEFLSYTGTNSNLEEDLQQAEAKADYPLALRLLFIRSLRILEDAMLISFKKDKTNSEYLDELRLKAQYPYVERLTHWFERVHYGEYEINSSQYAECKELFSQMRQTLKGGTDHG